jgi:hypothetical protein
MLDLTNFLLPMLGFLIVGIVGITFWIAWMIFKARYQKQLKANEAAPVSTPPFSVARRGAYLLAVNRAPDGSWEITVNGGHYPSLEAVPDDAVRKDVVAGLKEVVAFARSYVQKDQATKQSPVPATPIAPDSRVPPLEKPGIPPSSVPQTAPPPTDKPRIFLKDEPPLKRPDAAPMIMPALDLTREIGEIVAEMQAHIPSMAHRSIKLQDAPGGGVCFAIDGIVYSDVNEIADADVQALIRAATKEWERR